MSGQSFVFLCAVFSLNANSSVSYLDRWRVACPLQSSLTLLILTIIQPIHTKQMRVHIWYLNLNLIFCNFRKSQCYDRCSGLVKVNLVGVKCGKIRPSFLFLSAGLHPVKLCGYPGSSFGVGKVHSSFCSGMFSQEDQTAVKEIP